MMRQLLLMMPVVIFIIVAGCSGADTLSTPRDENAWATAATANHHLWGLWQFVADPGNETLDITPLRGGNFHLNALTFLEPPPLVNLTLENLQFNGNIIEADIGLRHPFLGMHEFSGFDVCGILISNGSVTGFSDPNLRMAGEGDTRLLNPDGYSRWWNPSEFPVNEGTMFSYNDGLLGTPDSLADYDCTLNGYKYYCDDLADIDDTLADITLANRGLFSAGQKNIRHYTIEIGTDGLIFNYAIDASWQFPSGSPPYVAPDDFEISANRPEAYRIEVTETVNTLWNDGGDSGGSLGLSIDVYDWHNAGLNTVRMESPGCYEMVETSTPVAVEEGYATFEIQVNNTNPIPQKLYNYISVISEDENFGGFIDGTNTTAYFVYEADVAGEQAEQIKNLPLRDDAEARDLAVTPEGDLLILYDDAQVWKYYAADGFLQSDAVYLFAAQVVPWETTGQMCDTYIDIGPTGDIFASAASGTGFDMDSWPCQVFNSTGSPIGDAPAPGTGGPVPDVYIYPASGPYYNNHMVIAPDSSGNQNNMYRHVNTDYWAQIYQTAGENATTGYDKVRLLNVVGSEGVSGNQFWLIEDDPDYYAARWMHTGPSYGYFNFDNAWFGTGTQTEDDTGWCDAKDMTWDASGRFYVLDELEAGQGRIKLFESGSPGTALTANAAGDASSISETPLRIEGSQYDSGDFGNLVFVLHGDAIPSMLSLFPPEDFGF